MTYLRLGMVLLVTAAMAAACNGPSATSSPQVSSTPQPTSFQESGSPATSTNPRSASPQPSAPPSVDLEWTTTGAFLGTGGPAMVEDLVVLGDVIVATGIGYEQPLPNFGPTPHRARVWISVDGHSWEAVELGDEFQDANLGAVVVLADGTLLAMGSRSTSNEHYNEVVTPAAWTSVDGRSWSEASSGLPGTPSRIVQGARGYVALLRGEQEPDELWHSSDGFTWERVRRLEANAVAVGAGPEGFVVAGSAGPDDTQPFVIASGDGREWFDASSPPPGPVNHVAPLGGDWVVMNAFGPDDARGITWFSASGLDWSALGRAEMEEVPIQDGRCFEYPARLSTAGPWLILATSLSFPCSEGGFEVHGRQQLSVDGAAWSPLPFEVGTPGVSRSGAFVNAAAAVGGRLILAGEQDGAATFWIGEPR